MPASLSHDRRGGLVRATPLPNDNSELDSENVGLEPNAVRHAPLSRRA